MALFCHPGLTSYLQDTHPILHGSRNPIRRPCRRNFSRGREVEPFGRKDRIQVVARCIQRRALRLPGCVANPGSSAARGSCRENGGSHRWLEGTGQATIQVFETVAAMRKGDVMKILVRLTLVPKEPGLRGGRSQSGLVNSRRSCVVSALIAILFGIDGTLLITAGAGTASWRPALDELALPL